MASKNKNIAELLDANGDVLLSNLDNISVTAQDVSDMDNASTGQFTLPSGTTAQQPATSYEGAQRFNTELGVMEYYDGTSWKKVSAQIPVISSTSGRIYDGWTSDITITGNNFLVSAMVVNFNQSDDSIDENVTVTPTSNTSVTVTVPSAVYSNVTSGNVVDVRVTNSDSATSSSASITATGLPSGGTITTSGDYRIHRFTSSGTFTVPSGVSFSSRESLIVAGGGGGGNDNAGGGGAGGLIHNTSDSFSAGNSYSVTIGGGGGAGANSGGDGGPYASNGSNSVFNSQTAIGGGRGGSGGGANATSGGSGGGGSGEAADGVGGAGTSGQGNRGGDVSGSGGGGGGGAGAAGQDGDVRAASKGGYGGAGLQKSITGSNTYYAAGGNGGNDNGQYETQTSTNGIGGISNTNSSTGATAGATNTGSGGGATTHTVSPVGTGNGGSGVVVIRYELD